MMMMKCIEIPNPAEMRSIVAAVQEKRELERLERQRKIDQKNCESAVKLIEFLTDRIIERSAEGYTISRTRVADSNLLSKCEMASRAEFHFEGQFEKAVDIIKEVFAKSGYQIKIDVVDCKTAMNKYIFCSGLITIQWE